MQKISKCTKVLCASDTVMFISETAVPVENN